MSRKVTWIVVGHRAGVHIFTKSASDPQLRSHRTWEHPQGRLRTGELSDDRDGITFDPAGPGQRRMEPPLDPTEQLAQSFANDVATYLDHARHDGQFTQLVLIAGPRFLGRLREALSDATQATVIGSVDKNLGEVTASDVEPRLDAFPIWRCRREAHEGLCELKRLATSAKRARLELRSSLML